MITPALNRNQPKGDATRAKIKATAQHLFALYGIDTVTIRDIAQHSGQKNGGSVNYYFGSKEELVVEIINDVAKTLNELRVQALDELEASGAKITIRGILKILISTDSTEGTMQMRLITMLQSYRRDLMHTEIPGRWDDAFRRCVDHLHTLLPPYPEKILRQRLYFLIPFLWTFLATREGGESQAEFWKGFWADPSALESLLDTGEGMLVHSPSADTLQALDQGDL